MIATKSNFIIFWKTITRSCIQKLLHLCILAAWFIRTNGVKCLNASPRYIQRHNHFRDPTFLVWTFARFFKSRYCFQVFSTQRFLKLSFFLHNQIQHSLFLYEFVQNSFWEALVALFKTISTLGRVPSRQGNNNIHAVKAD